MDPDNLGRDANGGGVRRDLAEDHGVGGDARVVVDGEGAQHLGAGADHHVVSDGGMALSLILSRSAQCHALIEQAVVPNLRGLTDDNAHAVVNDQTVADGGSGVDLDAGFPAGVLGNAAGQEIAAMAIQPVCDTVIDHGMNAGVQQEDLQLAPGSGVTLLISG